MEVLNISLSVYTFAVQLLYQYSLYPVVLPIGTGGVQDTDILVSSICSNTTLVGGDPTGSENNYHILIIT